MRKRIIGSDESDATPHDDSWLNLDEVADVEITSEDPAHPIEAALTPGHAPGWRAAGPGPQTIRLTFATPRRIRRIWLRFVETRVERTQEYVVRWSPEGDRSLRDVVRQQWNFSPHGATIQSEDHHVTLEAVSVLEIVITPGTTGGDDIASMECLRVA